MGSSAASPAPATSASPATPIHAVRMRRMWSLLGFPFRPPGGAGAHAGSSARRTISRWARVNDDLPASERRGQAGKLRILPPRLGGFRFEQPERFGDVLEEVLLSLHLGEKSVGAQRLHVALETAREQALQKARFIERRERIGLHLAQVVGEQPL